MVESVPASWTLDTVSFLKEIFFLDDSAIVRVDDVDMNLNLEALEQDPMYLFSDSDVAGIKVNTVATSVNFGYFVAIICTSQNSSSSGNRLYVTSGGEIFTKYDVHTLPKPFSKSDHSETNSSVNINSSLTYLERFEISSSCFF